MLHTLFGTTSTVQVDVKKTIFQYAMQSYTEYVISTLKKHNIDPSDPGLVDDFGHNLLHISVKTKNYDLATYLINNKINMTRQNKFYETPFDIALKNHDKKMVEVLLDCNNINFHKTEVTRLTNSLAGSQTNNQMLTIANKDLTIKNSGLQVQLGIAKTELEQERRVNKRKFEEYEGCFQENKRLKTDNLKLHHDNMILENTLTNLRNSMKKK